MRVCVCFVDFRWDSGLAVQCNDEDARNLFLYLHGRRKFDVAVPMSKHMSPLIRCHFSVYLLEFCADADQTFVPCLSYEFLMAFSVTYM